jgi:hypothetical protein
VLILPTPALGTADVLLWLFSAALLIAAWLT